VHDDDARYQHSAYQQKCMKLAPKLAREKVPNEEIFQVERKLLGHTRTPVGDETAHTMSLEHDPMSYNDAIACPDAKFWKKAMAEELEECHDLAKRLSYYLYFFSFLIGLTTTR